MPAVREPLAPTPAPVRALTSLSFVGVAEGTAVVAGGVATLVGAGVAVPAGATVAVGAAAATPGLLFVVVVFALACGAAAACLGALAVVLRGAGVDAGRAEWLLVAGVAAAGLFAARVLAAGVLL